MPGVKPGDVIAGKYRVDRVLGVGGMGVVVAAHHIQLDDRVAIKFLLPETLANKEAVARFAREARAAVKIKSEHVARVSDVGTLETGAPYMVMEYLEGGDLSTWVAQRGALPVERAVEFVLQACEAIAEAHALGIVHRDLKPANLFVARLPGGVESVKVLDFGISKVTGLGVSGATESATKTSALMGSPLYMSPEQMQSAKDVDPRADIWALGVILYELLTGVSPFSGDTMPELVLKIVSSAPRALRNSRPDAPDGLEDVILRCLEKDPGKRFQTVGELAPALLPFAPKRARRSVDRISLVLKAAGFGASALALPPSSDGDGPEPSPATIASFGGTAPGAGRTKPVLLVGFAVLVLVGVGAVLLRPRAPAPEAAGSNAFTAQAAADRPSPVPSPEAAARTPEIPAKAIEPLPPASTEPVVTAEPPARQNKAGARTAVKKPARSASGARPSRASPPDSEPQKPAGNSLIDERH
jgi:eukaryotic-like serine/threonine-protein kinase